MDGRDLTPPTRPPRRLLAMGFAGALTGLLLAAAIEIYHTAVGGNVHEVIPGVVYRSSQPTPERVQELVEKYHIRTVINMRGCCDPTPWKILDRRDPSPWYEAESRTTMRLDLSQEDLPFSAGRLPSVPVIRELVSVLDHSERPILVHCYQGIDRTGMASVMALLLYTDIGLDKALGQLGLRYGHLPFGHTGNIDRFFDLYREWLAAQGREHTPANFRHWVEEEYCPGECLASIEILEPRGEPLRMTVGQPLAVHVLCTNRSIKPWRLRPGGGEGNRWNPGIHAFWQILGENDRGCGEGHAGMFNAEVPPQGAIELTLALPAMYAPGHYRLRVDMVDEQHAYFHQLGPEPLTVELEVR